jgi:L-amino acid N-acyltransferase YncA
MSLAVRPATSADIPAITKIYAHHVTFGLASFEEIPPSEAEFAGRHAEVTARGLPFLVACDGEGRVLGYAYANLYRQRSAYRFTLEDSIYIAPTALRRGVGRRLLAALIEQSAAAGYRQMIAVIGDSENAPSINLHEQMGFRHAGVLEATGFKHGRWVDSVLMQRALGGGATTKPREGA